MNDQQTLNALRVAGKMLAPIFLAEQNGTGGISITPQPNGFRVAQCLYEANFKVASGEAETLDAAFIKFLANRSDALRNGKQEAEDRAAFEAWKAQNQRQAA